MFSLTTEYALRAVSHLAAQKAGAAPTTAEIARDTKIPKNYLAKVVRSLSRAGFVHSQRGPGGGHTLARDPSEITVLQIVNAVDPLERIQSCPLGVAGHRDLCPLHRRLDSAIAMVEDAFNRTTISELVSASNLTSSSCLFPRVPLGHAVLSVPGATAK